MKILLTGSNGFVGSGLSEALSGHQLQLINQNEYASIIDVRSKVRWCDVVAHIGAVADTMENDVNYMMKNNWLHSKTLFDLAESYDKKVVFASTAAIYGNNEDYLNAYAWSKHVAESYGLLKVENFISLRYFNVYGPGEGHKGKMASVANQALIAKSKNQVPFKLFKGNPTRDFIYIKDIVEATRYAILNNHEKGIYDVGTSESRSFEDVLDILNIPYEYTGGKLPSHYQMYTRAQKTNWLKGWLPKYMLEDGLMDYKEWFTSQVSDAHGQNA